MASEFDPWLLLPAPVRRLPADLAAIICFVIVTCTVVLVPGLNETPIRVVLGFPFVLFPPGYAFVAALFPEAGTPTVTDEDGENEEGDADTGRWRFSGGIDGVERVAISFGMSIVLVPLIGLGLNFTPWGIRLVPLLLSISAFTLGATLVAVVRRRDLPEEERFSVPYRTWVEDARDELFDPETRADKLLNVALVLCILLAAAGATYAIGVPKQGESFTEVYLLTKNDDGKLVADDYPTNFTQGERKPVVVGIGNHEHRHERYTVVVLLQNVTMGTHERRSRTNANESGVATETTIHDQRELQRLHANVERNGTWRTTYRVAPPMTGTRLRLTFLVYKGNPPKNPTADNAYRELHLWINVTGGNGSE
ncbi:MULTISPECIES: DUF1616 domain-containing protein [unclassified Haladaptatus]|uniref:DUF1616 domain-containing protein n=1 Tax=unclassified Haladaptatus TaxID=2622732 RepID=UPI00209BD382|nr:MULTISPECIES: DUF1616 domain-containing protein [unclassified Haladaptatus]MCO8244760.1 DUF1616 domain-containing protein [Haladaptatus sp. AB643]MCO8255728.1 DUF1616 domain-containing protein [Haladaptatus sp. AB618]